MYKIPLPIPGNDNQEQGSWYTMKMGQPHKPLIDPPPNLAAHLDDVVLVLKCTPLPTHQGVNSTYFWYMS